MTVKELIELLSKEDPEKEIVVYDGCIYLVPRGCVSPLGASGCIAGKPVIEKI